MADLPDDTLVVYSDYVCPFCYLGKHTAESYLDEADDPPDVEWRPFDLRGGQRRADGTLDRSIDTGKDETYFERVRRNVERLRDEYDVEMRTDLDLDVDSWNAQLVALHLQDEHGDEAFRAFHDRVFEALWTDGADVGDADVLRDLAESAGLDPDIVDEALGDPGLEDRLRRRFEEARSLGVTGVPTFVYDRRAIPGAVPPEQIARLVEDPSG